MANRKTKQHTITAIKGNFKEPVNCSYLDLLEGFEELYSINTGADLEFLNGIMPNFKSCEVIIGLPSTVPATLENILAMQRRSLQLICHHDKMPELKERMEASTLKIYMGDGSLSIEQLICMRNSEGKTRVIVGASNLDQFLYNGQRNNSVVYFDELEAFTYYMKIFNEFKQENTWDLSSDALTIGYTDRELLESLPIIKRSIAAEEHIYNIAPKSTIVADVEFRCDIEELAKDFVDLPKANRKGELQLNTVNREQIIDKTLDNMEARRAKFEKFMPQLVIEPAKNRATYNEREYNLQPNRNEVKHDAQTYLEYMEGFSTAVPAKNIASLRFEYFKLMSWCFLSPFLARIRTTIREATVTDEVFTYPIVALLCGQSNAGKTIYASMLIKMMTNSALYKAFGQSNFTKTKTDALLCDIKGLPILIDDITQTQFTNNSGNIIKQEERIIRETKPENLNYYPAMLLTANKDVNSLKNELTKRMVIFHVSASWNNEVTRQQKSPCSELIQKMKNSLYSEYLRRFIPKINKYLSEITDLGNSPMDLYEESSNTIIEIFTDCGLELPPYMRTVTMKDYFDSHSVNEIMIKFFQKQYNHNREFFEVDKEKNQLTFEDKTLNTVGKLTPLKIVDSLPPELEAELLGEKIVMRLDSARDFFGIDFKNKGFFEKLFNR